MIFLSILYRYGREDEEVMGLKFCNEAIIALKQIWPRIDDKEELSYLQVWIFYHDLALYIYLWYIHSNDILILQKRWKWTILVKIFLMFFYSIESNGLDELIVLYPAGYVVFSTLNTISFEGFYIKSVVENGIFMMSISVDFYRFFSLLKFYDRHSRVLICFQ